MFNYFVFDGHDSRDYGVYISGSGTFNSPAREYDNISIPGRDGDLLGINTRLQNVTLTYPAGVVSDFSNNIAGLRNMLLSTVGYAVLRDSYHPDEYRYAVYKGGLAPDPLSDLSAGEFNIVFECKPQRYLDSGGEVRDVDAWGTTDTETGDIVSFDGEPQTGIKDLTVAITPVQAGTGDPAPDNVRAISGWTGANVHVDGENLLNPALCADRTASGLKSVVQADGGIKLTGTASTNVRFFSAAGNELYLKAGTYYAAPTLQVRPASGGIKTGTFTLASDEVCTLSLEVVANQVYNEILYLYLRITSGNYVPYNGNIKTINWTTAGTVYGGMLDVTTGELTVTHGYVDLGTLSWTYNANWNGGGAFYLSTKPTGIKLPASQSTAINGICSRYKVVARDTLYNAPTDIALCVPTNGLVSIRDSNFNDAGAFTTAMSGVLLVYELATPQTYTLTPEQIATLIGTNNIWADCGNIKVEYGDDPAKLLNPTLMPARPLIRVYGYGTLVVGNVTVTISNYSLSYIDIDCAMMDCYNGATNLNGYVTFSGNDFPVLGPGATGVSYSGSITKVLITTNWWRV